MIKLLLLFLSIGSCTVNANRWSIKNSFPCKFFSREFRQIYRIFIEAEHIETLHLNNLLTLKED